MERLGRYEIVKEIGRGGMGIIYQARDTELDREVALKVLRDEHAGSRSLRRFKQEATTAARIRHPGIVAIHDVGEENGTHYICMDLVDGRPLDAVIQRRERKQEELVRMVAEVARALEAAHEEGVLHRDIKPGNILISSDGRPLLTDFGLALVVNEQTRITHSDTVLGTPFYMSPEQIRGEEIDVRADLYSLGVVLYEALTGRVPHPGRTPAEVHQRILKEEPDKPGSLVPGLPGDLEAVCLKAMEKERHYRYPTAGALADDLERWLRGEPVEATPPSVARKLAVGLRKHAVLVAAILLAGVAALAVGIAMRPDPIPAPPPGDSRIREASPHHDRALKEFEATTVMLYQKSMKPPVYLRKLGDALRAANDALGIAPNYYDVLLLRARIWRRMGQMQNAVEDLDRAIEQRPEGAVPYAERALTRLQTVFGSRDPNSAFLGDVRRDLQKATDRGGRPAEEDLRLLQAWLAVAEKNWTVAVEITTDLIENEVKPEDAHLLRGLVYRSQERYDEAIDDFTKTIEWKPNEYKAYFQRALCFALRKKLQESLADFTRVAQLAPYLETTYSNRAGVKVQLGQYESAIIDADRTLGHRPTDLFGRINRGLARLRLGRKKDALIDLDEAVRHHPNHYRSWLIRSVVHQEMGHRKAAIRDAEKASDLMPDSSEVWDRLGVAYMRGQHYEDALRAFDKAIHLKPNQGHLYRNRAAVHIVLKNNQAAIDDLKVAKNQLPDDPGVAMNLVTAYWNLKRCEELIEAAAPAFRHPRYRAQAHRFVGQAHLVLNQPKLAEKHLSLALREMPNQAACLANRAQVYVVLGRFDDAEADCRKLDLLKHRFQESVDRVREAIKRLRDK